MKEERKWREGGREGGTIAFPLTSASRVQEKVKEREKSKKKKKKYILSETKV